MRFARRRGLACGAITLGVLLGRLLALAWIPVPNPSIHDEFSYLLAGQTFAGGHVANPTHPLWIFFETFNVIHEPAYVSKYPPLQGAALAVGFWLGHPWIGVWLTTALMCGAVCWMLQGWLPPGLALVGATIAALRVGIAGYWMNSYWGGSVAAIGGALLLGALIRLRRNSSPLTWTAFAAGLAILANSRPFEGLLLALICGGMLLYWKRRGAMRSFRVALIPVLVIGCTTVACMAAYNYQITGSAATLPYIVHERQYAVAPAFTFLPPRPVPNYHHEVMRQLWSEWEVRQSEISRANPVFATLFKLSLQVTFYLGSLACLIVLLPLLAGSTWRIRTLGLILALFTAGLMTEKAPLPHYMAPASGVIWALAAIGVARWWRTRPLGWVVAAGVLCFWTVQAGMPERADTERYRLDAFGAERQRMVAELNRQTGQHLVIVRYSPTHTPHQEWVYNEANIDAAKIVWARDRGDAANRPLFEYFRNRQVWLLEPDPFPARRTLVKAGSSR